MHSIKHSTLTSFTAEQMYHLMNDVNSYPQFLTFCEAAEILSVDENALTAKLTLNAHGVKKSFVTRNTLQPFEKIEMHLVEGPFKTFEAGWQFIPQESGGSQVSFYMNYAFSVKLMDMIMGPLFKKLGDDMVQNFVKRAKIIYAD